MYIAGAPTAGTNSTITNPLAFQVGSGNAAFNGNVGIGTTSPVDMLTVGTTAIPTATILAQFQNAGGTCTLDPSVTGGLSCSSDMTLKKNITNLSDNSPWSFNNNITYDNQDILTKILALNPVDYNWNVEPDSAQKHAGFIAQEVQQVFPDLVETNPQTGTLSLNYTGLVPYTIEAIKEMNLNVTSIDDLTRDNTWRDALENWLADSANGINQIFGKSLNATQQVCIGPVGSQTCVTQQQLQQLLQNNDDTIVVPSNPPTTPLPDDATQSPDVSAPVVATSTPDTATPAVVPIIPDNTADTASSD